MKRWIVCFLLAVFGVCISRGEQVSEAPRVQGALLTLYDRSMGLVRERRTVNLLSGENLVVLPDVPAGMDPSTLFFTPPASVMGVETASLNFRNDLADPLRFLARGYGHPLIADTAERRCEGTLLRVMGTPGRIEALALAVENDGVAMLPWEDVRRVEIPGVADAVYPRPTLLWRLTSQKDQMQSVRLNYAVDGLHWDAEYNLILSEDRKDGHLSGKIKLSNQAGGDFENASLRLVATEKGVAEQLETEFARDQDAFSESQRRFYFGSTLLKEERVFDGLNPVFTYACPQSVSLSSGDEKFIRYVDAERMPMVQQYVYDGVVFDRFQRNRRNDWNYGAESRRTVEVYLNFQNSQASGLPGDALAPGIYRLFQRLTDGGVDYLGETFYGVVPAGAGAALRLGAARDLSGWRERVGYSEVVPLHEYEETFEIQLKNGQSEDVVILVVEHLYRWSNFDIVKSDSEYERRGEDVIVFKPLVKAGGSRTLRYTVRYRW
ncbi:MAG: hypothetical protein PHG65_12000 [Kiritimatiellae bacterium]|nr:hypothetical protein [Kiritimatiellia bacterium]